MNLYHEFWVIFKLDVDAWNATDSLKYADVNEWDCNENKQRSLKNNFTESCII